MTKEEIITTIADILEEDAEEIIEDRELDSYELWDSVAVLSVISLVNEQTGKFLYAKDIEKLKTVGDLMKAFEG